MDSDTVTRAEATNAVESNSSSRNRRETARPRRPKGANERGGPGADRGRRRASAWCPPDSPKPFRRILKKYIA